MAKAGDEMSHWAEYDYVVVNRDLDRALRRSVVGYLCRKAAETRVARFSVFVVNFSRTSRCRFPYACVALSRSERQVKRRKRKNACASHRCSNAMRGAAGEREVASRYRIYCFFLELFTGGLPT